MARPVDKITRKPSCQIRLVLISSQIGVGCACLRDPIEVRSRWDAAEALAVWRAWHTDMPAPKQPVPAAAYGGSGGRA